MSHFSVLLLSLCVVALARGDCTSQNCTSYYKGINWSLKGNALRSQLGKLLFPHTKLSYNAIWSVYQNLGEGLFNCSGSTIWGVYSATCFKPSQQCGNYKKEGDCFNREHAYPKSWWGGGDGAGAHDDLFLVLPADGYVNNLRANSPFGYVPYPTYTSTSGAKVGPCGPKTGYIGSCFEPADEFKGFLARVTFYTATTYYKRWSCCNTAGTDQDANIKPWLLKILLQWNNAFPPNADEIYRNEVIFGQYQHNRNPYIDYARLADDVFNSH